MAQNMTSGKLIILVAPSGSGKTTIAQKLLDTYPQLRFSISETTRPPRENEEHGRTTSSCLIRHLLIPLKTTAF
jgi:guanylate kinase